MGCLNDEFDLVAMLEVEVGWQLDFYLAQSHERPFGVFLPELILVKPMEGTRARAWRSRRDAL